LVDVDDDDGGWIWGWMAWLALWSSVHLFSPSSHFPLTILNLPFSTSVFVYDMLLLENTTK
jgi:hypothetical protein